MCRAIELSSLFLSFSSLFFLLSLSLSLQEPMLQAQDFDELTPQFRFRLASDQVPFGLVAASSGKPTETTPDSLYQECVSLNQQRLIVKYIFDGAYY